MWAFLFSGRLARIPYALVALPLLVIQYLTPVISTYAPIFFDKVLDADLVSFHRYAIALSFALDVLVLILTIVSAKRLRDIGLTGWLALPILLKLLLGLAVGFLKTQAIADGTVVDSGTQQAMTWALHGLYYYGYALALFLLIMPGRSRPTKAMTPASVL